MMALLSVSKSQGKNCIIMMFLVIMIVHAVVPSSYVTVKDETVSVSGSSATGHCSSVTSTGITSTCTDPTSSVLFDGVIPTLTGLDGDMWASHLLTLQTTATRTPVVFNFADTPGGRLEVVMFNCPEKGISVPTIRISTSVNTLFIVDIISCDSLVRVCTPITATHDQPSITLEFVTGATFDMVYLAEVTFYAASSALTCPPGTIITTAPPDTIITTAPPDTIITTGPPDNMITTAVGTDGTTMTTTPPPDTTMAMGSIITSVTIPVVVVICVVFMIVGIMAAVLIQWRYHKHKTSHHIALGEGHSHAHTHSHPPPIKMCEETGQVCYFSPPEDLGQLSPSHDTHSHLQRDASEGRGGAQSHQGGSNEGEYSTLSHGNSPHVLGGGGEDSASQLYAQVAKKEKKKNKKGTSTEMSTLATYSSLEKERSCVHSSEADTGIDQLYAQVDDKKGTYPEVDTAADMLYSQVDKKKKKKGTHPHTPVADEDIDQLYSQVDKKKKKGEVAHLPTQVPNADIDQLYSQVDKKKKKKGEVAAHPHTPVPNADIDQLYSQVDKKVKKKKSEVAAHPLTTEAHTLMDQLYAQVDKKRSKK